MIQKEQPIKYITFQVQKKRLQCYDSLKKFLWSSNKITYENIRKTATVQRDDYTTGCLLDDALTGCLLDDAAIIIKWLQYT